MEFIVSGERIHELCSFLHQMIVFLNHLIRRIGTVNEFGQIDKMRLLPNQETAYIRWSFRSAGIGHFHPTHSVESLTAGYLTGNRFDRFVPAECTVQQFGMPPKCLPSLMPPYHFEVELAKP